MILVTGGTGLVGAHLLLHLLHGEVPVKAIHRASSNLDHVKGVFAYYSSTHEELFQKIQWIEADLDNIPALELAFKGVTHVYHCAALISFDPRDFSSLQKNNVQGTANIINLCVSRKIKKLCYVSSIGAIGRSLNGAMSTEDNEWQDANVNEYALTKHLAELEVWRGTQEGVPAVVVNPGIILGPGFWNSGSGVLFKIASRGPRFYPPGGSGFVTVNDVVKMMVQLMDSDIKNERFIAVDKNLTYKEILSIITRQFGKRTPKKQLKFWQLEVLWRLDYVWSYLSGNKRKLTKKSVESLKKPELYSNAKVVDKLNFEFELMAGNIYYTCNRFKDEFPNLFA